MKDFIFYFKVGWTHILSWDATDHIYFITALAVVYTFFDWKKVLILVTAFTIGHAITLYLSALDLFRLDAAWVEFAIPCTIVLTALSNLLVKPAQSLSGVLQYALALGFGLIHGLGYANYIRMILARDQQLVWSLFSFNLGLETGQILVVLLVLSTKWMFVSTKFISARLISIFVSAFILIVSFVMVVERFKDLMN
jgi:hypothetical protein